MKFSILGLLMEDQAFVLERDGITRIGVNFIFFVFFEAVAKLRAKSNQRRTVCRLFYLQCNVVKLNKMCANYRVDTLKLTPTEDHSISIGISTHLSIEPIYLKASNRTVLVV